MENEDSTTKKPSREETLVRAAAARAKVVSVVGASEGAVTPDQILPELVSMGYSSQALSNLLYTMVKNKMIAKVKVTHPDYKFGYRPRMFLDQLPKESKRGKTGKIVSLRVPGAHSSVDNDIPISVTRNTRTGAVTVRYAGYRIEFNKED